MKLRSRVGESGEVIGTPSVRFSNEYAFMELIDESVWMGVSDTKDKLVFTKQQACELYVLMSDVREWVLDHAKICGTDYVAWAEQTKKRFAAEKERFSNAIESAYDMDRRARTKDKNTSGQEPSRVQQIRLEHNAAMSAIYSETIDKRPTFSGIEPNNRNDLPLAWVGDCGVKVTLAWVASLRMEISVDQQKVVFRDGAILDPIIWLGQIIVALGENPNRLQFTPPSPSSQPVSASVVGATKAR